MPCFHRILEKEKRIFLKIFTRYGEKFFGRDLLYLVEIYRNKNSELGHGLGHGETIYLGWDT